MKPTHCFEDFKDGYRFLMLTHRSKEGGTNKDRKQIKRISKNSEEFDKMVQELLEIKKNSGRPYRLYASVNARDINKAIRIFKQNQLNADYYSVEDRNSFYFDLKNRWISAFMQPQARAETNFLLDIDTKDNATLKDIETRLLKITRNFFRYETKNGYHIVSQPFNPNLLPDVDINKDGLMLLDY